MATLIDFFEESVTKFESNIYLWEKKDGRYEGTSYKSVKQDVYRIAAALINAGIEKGDRISLLSEGRNDWIISELAILYAGACCVPLSIRLEQDELRFRMEHSGSRMIIVSGLHLSKVSAILEGLPSLEKVIVLDETDILNPKITSMSFLRDSGDKILKENPQLLETRKNLVTTDDYANISYTSGTTADPKGIILSHGNYVTNVKQSLSLMNIPSYYRTLAILPWDHSFAHTTCLYCFMAMGASVGAPQAGKTNIESLKNIPVNIKELKPHLMMSVPAISMNFRKNIEGQVNAKGHLIASLFRMALKVSYIYNGLGINKGKGYRLFLSPLVALFDKLLFRKVREGLGGKMDFFIGGGALLDIELQRFFYAIGIPVCQGYGLSEASPVISSNSLTNIKFGTSGKVVKFLELKILDQYGNELPSGKAGEIVIKGGNVMKGYWNNPKATAEVLIDGWLHTGDMGFIDEDDYLVVLGRFKSLLIGNDGEKFSPEGIEEAIAAKSLFVRQIVLYNNQQPYTIGLVVPDSKAITDHLHKSGHKQTSDDMLETALLMIKDEINQWAAKGKYAGDFPERWLPSAFAILPEAFSQNNHLINSSLKLVRRKVFEYYEREIRFLYTAEGKNVINKINIRNLKAWF